MPRQVWIILTGAGTSFPGNHPLPRMNNGLLCYSGEQWWRLLLASLSPREITALYLDKCPLWQRNNSSLPKWQNEKIFQNIPVAGWFSTRGHLAMSRDIFGCHNWGCYWHLVGRDQGCCWRSLHAQDSLPQQRIIWPQIPIMWNVKTPAQVIH